MIDDFVNELRQSANIVVICRNQDQIAAVEARYGRRVQVIKDVVDDTALVKSVQLFVGAGGTMIAEAALLGRPTISIAPLQFYVEKCLLKSGFLRKATNSKSLVKLGRKMISERYRQAQKKKAARILARMEDLLTG